MSNPTPALAFLDSGLALLPSIQWLGERPAPGLVSIYPNPFGPAGVQFALQGQQQTAGGSILHIFDATGHLVYQKKISTPDLKLPADVFPAKGVYWYDIRHNDKSVSSGKLVYTG